VASRGQADEVLRGDVRGEEREADEGPGEVAPGEEEVLGAFPRRANRSPSATVTTKYRTMMA